MHALWLEWDDIKYFQGSECDVIVISCVRTESIGFVKESERLNVALTRARNALYVIGNFYALEARVTNVIY